MWKRWRGLLEGLEKTFLLITHWNNKCLKWHGIHISQVCFGWKWDIKFNPSKSLITTFGGANPQSSAITLNVMVIPWCDKIKYLGVVFQCKTGATDISNNIRKFYSQVNNILAVTGNSPQVEFERSTKQVALLWQRDRATRLSVEILQLTKHPI